MITDSQGFAVPQKTATVKAKVFHCFADVSITQVFKLPPSTKGPIELFYNINLDEFRNQIRDFEVYVDGYRLPLECTEDDAESVDGSHNEKKQTVVVVSRDAPEKPLLVLNDPKEGTAYQNAAMSSIPLPVFGSTPASYGAAANKNLAGAATNLQSSFVKSLDLINVGDFNRKAEDELPPFTDDDDDDDDDSYNNDSDTDPSAQQITITNASGDVVSVSPMSMVSQISDLPALRFFQTDDDTEYLSFSLGVFHNNHSNSDGSGPTPTPATYHVIRLRYVTELSTEFALVNTFRLVVPSIFFHASNVTDVSVPKDKPQVPRPLALQLESRNDDSGDQCEQKPKKSAAKRYSAPAAKIQRPVPPPVFIVLEESPTDAPGVTPDVLEDLAAVKALQSRIAARAAGAPLEGSEYTGFQRTFEDNTPVEVIADIAMRTSVRNLTAPTNSTSTAFTYSTSDKCVAHTQTTIDLQTYSNGSAALLSAAYYSSINPYFVLLIETNSDRLETSATNQSANTHYTDNYWNDVTPAVPHVPSTNGNAVPTVPYRDFNDSTVDDDVVTRRPPGYRGKAPITNTAANRKPASAPISGRDIELQDINDQTRARTGGRPRTVAIDPLTIDTDTTPTANHVRLPTPPNAKFRSHFSDDDDDVDDDELEDVDGLDDADEPLDPPPMESLVADLQSMGFDGDQSRLALSLASNNIDTAISYLIEGLPPRRVGPRTQRSFLTKPVRKRLRQQKLAKTHQPPLIQQPNNSPTDDSTPPITAEEVPQPSPIADDQLEVKPFDSPEVFWDNNSPLITEYGAKTTVDSDIDAADAEANQTEAVDDGVTEEVPNRFVDDILLLQSQKFGYWRLNAEFARRIQMSLAMLKLYSPANYPTTQERKAWATAIAVAVLQSYASSPQLRLSRLTAIERGKGYLQRIGRLGWQKKAQDTINNFIRPGAATDHDDDDNDNDDDDDSNDSDE